MKRIALPNTLRPGDKIVFFDPKTKATVDARFVERFEDKIVTNLGMVHANGKAHGVYAVAIRPCNKVNLTRMWAHAYLRHSWRTDVIGQILFRSLDEARNAPKGAGFDGYVELITNPGAGRYITVIDWIPA
jgi:hypothetical protein